MVTLARCQNPACPLPDGLFEQTRKNNVYCSPACRQAALRNRQKESQETLLDQRLRKLPGSVASQIKAISEEHTMDAAIQALGAVNLLLNIAEVWPKDVFEVIQPDQQKLANLEAELARYRQICDISDRRRLEDRFLALGEAFNYRRLIHYSVQPGEEHWHAFMQDANDMALAEALVHTEAIYQNWMGFVETTDLNKAERRIAVLEQTLERYAIADQKAKEAITELQFSTNRSGNRIDSMEQGPEQAKKTIEQYESSQKAMNDAEDQRLLELRQAFMKLGERQAYRSMNLAHLRTICPGIIEDTIGEGKDRWEWACESSDQGALMVVLTSAFSLKQEDEENETHVQKLEQALEETRAKHSMMMDEHRLASRKISNLERHVQRYERMGILRTRESMLQELMVLGGRLKYACLTDLGIGEGIDTWLNHIRGLSDADLSRSIAHGYWQADSLAMAAIEASDGKVGMQMRKRINELESDVKRRDERIADLERQEERHSTTTGELSKEKIQGLEYAAREYQVIAERQMEQIAELRIEREHLRTEIGHFEESHCSTMFSMNILLAQAQSGQQEGTDMATQLVDLERKIEKQRKGSVW